MIDIQALLEVAVEATSIGREVFLTQAPGARTAKGDRDYATEVDYAVERKIRAFLAESTPSIGVLGEEEGGSGDRSQMQWALDPVDGTINFAQGIPLCGISLALVADRRPVVGVIDLPFLDTRYTAAAGEGAHRDGEPIRASGTSQLRDAMVSGGDYTVGRDAEPKNRVKLALTARLAREALRVRMFGSAALDLAWVADGKTDALIMLSNQPWDTAAGVAIAKEAGVRVVDLDGSDHTLDSRATIAATPRIIDDILALIRDAHASQQPG